MNLQVRFRTKPGIELEFSDGTSLGDPEDPSTLRIAAFHLQRWVENQCGPWPEALREFQTPEARHEAVRRSLQEGEGGPARESLLRPYLLTHSLGTSLDGTFTTLVPIGEGSPQSLHLRSESDRGIRQWVLNAASYRAAVGELIAQAESVKAPQD